MNKETRIFRFPKSVHAFRVPVGPFGKYIAAFLSRVPAFRKHIRWSGSHARVFRILFCLFRTHVDWPGNHFRVFRKQICLSGKLDAAFRDRFCGVRVLFLTCCNELVAPVLFSCLVSRFLPGVSRKEKSIK